MDGDCGERVQDGPLPVERRFEKRLSRVRRVSELTQGGTSHLRGKLSIDLVEICLHTRGRLRELPSVDVPRGIVRLEHRETGA